MAKLRALITLPEVEKGVRRQFRVEKDSAGSGFRLLHDFSVGSEQLELVIPDLNDGDKVKTFLYPLSNVGVVGNSPVTAEFTAQSGNKQEAAAPESGSPQLGYEVQMDDGTELQPRMRQSEQQSRSASSTTTASPTTANTVGNQPQGTGGRNAPATQSPATQPVTQSVGAQPALNPNLSSNLNGPPSHPVPTGSPPRPPQAGEVALGSQETPARLGPK
jgi:hypothetical protein